MLQKVKFRVIHVTSQEDEYPASELNVVSPNTKGWRSAKKCPYPQQIVVELEEPSRIRKIQILSHQYLIGWFICGFSTMSEASKLEFFVGNSYGEDTANMETSRFQRLGHVELSNNESTQYKARELKSIHVDACGSYFQIFLYKNYTNFGNLNNQISIIALNFIGEPIIPLNHENLSYGSASNSLMDLSPVDDLAFGIYHDPQFVDIIRKLQSQKLEYAQQENFDMAKKIRDAVRIIQETSEHICRLEFEKKEAVKLERYEEAKEIKEQINHLQDELARNVDLDSLLNTNSPQHYFKPIMLQKQVQNRASRQFASHRSSDHDPTILDMEPCSSDSTASSGDAFPARHVHNTADERPLPALLRKQTNNSNGSAVGLSHIDDANASANVVVFDGRGEEHGLSEETVRKAGVAIDVVGLPLVKSFYSRSWKHREQALDDLLKRITTDPLPPPVLMESMSSDPDPVGELRSTTFLLKKALNEPVLPLYRKALEMIKPTIVDFSEQYRIAKSELFASIDSIVRLLLQRTGDSSQRVREITKSQLTDMGKWPIFRTGGGFWHEILRPFQPTTLERLALCQIQVINSIYADLIDSSDQFPFLEDLILFTVQALEHRSNEVREMAESLIVALYRSEDRNLVRQLMPPNDYEAQRQPLYRRIFAMFDKLDGREHSSAVLPQHNNAPYTYKCKQRNQNKQTKKPLPSKKQPSAVGVTPVSAAAEVSLSAITNPSDLDLLLSLDKTCIFCGERNEGFTEEALDLHYWKACPMLRRCPNCKQVVEISGMTEHLLNECPEASKLGGYRRCERCSEAVPNASFLSAHGGCKPAPNPALRCPLCHADLPDLEGCSAAGIDQEGSGYEEAWRTHLIEECRQNSRIMRPTPQESAATSHRAEVIFPGKKAVVKRVNVR